ncbi:MAG: hypothetical protein JXA71_00365 [Chitinispirillaceae bacterium]|nr:hypothetical protein [Chitinispirillaceae bacterium]
MTADPDTYLHYNKEIVFDIFRKKEEFHCSQARLPIEEKIKILVELQKMALTIRPKQGEDDKRTVWRI